MEHQDNILKVEKINKEQTPSQYETFCLEEFKDEMKIYAEQELEKCGKSHAKVEVFKNHGDVKFLVHTDRKKLRRIFTILLDNAVKQTGRYILFDYHISSFAPALNRVSFFVDNTGFGIHDETELNYSIAKGLVEQMDGDFEVRPAREAGTSVHFSIVCTPCDFFGN
jgi:signal transduction histidine kinase